MTIDIDKLKEDLQNDRLGAFFGGGFGGAQMEAFDIEDATHEELLEIAVRNGANLEDYEV